MWTIYSIGDAAFLQQVLQGVGMLCGAGDYAGAAKVASLIGVIAIAFRSIHGGAASIDFKEPFVAILMFVLLFGTTTTVAIESVATGAVVTVGKVPVGFAAAGSVVSMFGMKLTEDFEQAFSTPGMMQNGFASSLEAIKKVRINTMTVTGYGSANAPDPGADVYNSWVNYISECTIPALELKVSTTEQVMRTAPFMNSLVLSSPVNGTEIYIGNGATDTDCGTAFGQLTNYTTTRFVPALLAVLSGPLGGTVGSAADATTILTNALTGIGLGSTSVADFIETGVLVPIFMDTLAKSASSSQSFSYATMISDASRNRAAQWLGQETLFTMYVRPMMTFIEGFQYAIMPLAVLAFLLGRATMPLVGKLVAGLVWIQLWYPLLAIVNLFQEMSLTGAMATMAADGNAFTSMAGTLSGDQSVLAWLAIGGMLASSVPALSAALVFGGYQGVAAVAGQIGGGETLHSDVAAPRDIGQQYSGMVAGPLAQWDPTFGARAGGSERVDPAMTWRNEDTARVESSRQASEEKLEEFRRVYVSSRSNQFSVDDRGGQSSSVDQATRASTTQALSTTLSAAAQVAQQITDSTGLDKSVAWGMVAEAAGNLGGSLGTGRGRPGLGLNIGGNGGGKINLENREGVSESQRIAAENTLTRAFNEQPSLQSDLLSSIARDVRDNHDHSVFASRQQSDQSSLQNAAATALHATEAYQQAVAASVSGGTTQTVSAQAAVNAVRSNPKAREELAGAILRFGLGKEARVETNHNLRPWLARYGGEDGADIMGQLVALGGYDTNVVSHGDGILRKAALGRVMSSAFGGELPVIGGAQRNEEIAAGVQGAAPAVAPGSRGSVESEVRAGLGGADRAVSSVTPDSLRARHDADVARQHEQGAELARPVAEGIVHQDQQRGEAERTPTTGEKLASAVGRVVEGVGDVGRLLRGGVEGWSSGTHARVEQYEREGREAGLTEAQARYFAYHAGLGAGFLRRAANIDEEAAAAAVRHEASEARMSPDQVIERLDAAVVGVVGGAGTMRLGDLAHTNQLHGLTHGNYSPGMDKALQRATGR